MYRLIIKFWDGTSKSHTFHCKDVAYECCDDARTDGRVAQARVVKVAIAAHASGEHYFNTKKVAL